MAVLRRLADDARTARRVLANGISSRKWRRDAERRFADVPRPQPGTVHIGVYFADPPMNLYQLRQWYGPLAELAETHPVVIIARSPASALALLDEAPVPVLYLRTIAEIEQLLAEQSIRLMFYVNQNTRNFQMFRYGRLWHVFINHGESDKSYMYSNQFKSYDYAFVAGQAALERLGTRLWDYDVDRRAIPIGRPQTDHLVGEVPFEPDERTVVFYAPTWEGDRPTMAYGSVASHGVALAEALLASPEHRLVYRPHPRSGVNEPEYAAANRRIIAAIAAANARDPRAQHVYDDGADLGWQLAVADVAITDISAMVYDRLATGRPIIVTRPASPTADVQETGFLGSAEWLRAEDAPDAVAFIDRVLGDPASRENLAHWAEHHFGDTAPGSATRRFHAAVERLIGVWETHAAVHADDGPDDLDVEAVDDEDDDIPPRDG